MLCRESESEFLHVFNRLAMRSLKSGVGYSVISGKLVGNSEVFPQLNSEIYQQQVRSLFLFKFFMNFFKKSSSFDST